MIVHFQRQKPPYKANILALARLVVFSSLPPLTGMVVVNLSGYLDKRYKNGVKVGRRVGCPGEERCC